MVRVIGGRPWGIVAGVFLLIQLMMNCASTAVTLSIAFNTLSNNAMCTVGFIGISCIGCWVLCSFRTVKFIAQTGVPCCVSILAASLIVMISLGVDGPSQAPYGWNANIVLIGKPSFRECINSCLKIIYAFAGNITFVSYMAEMRNPVEDFPFALRWLIVISISLYSTLAIVICCLAGEYTTSPALGSAPFIPAKVAYGIVLPAVFTTGLSNGHVAIKYLHVQLMRWTGATNQITKNNVRAWASWMTCVTVFWIVCFVVSSAIPIFDSIISISAATTFAWFTYGLSAIFWFHLNKGSMFDGWKQIILFCINVFLILLSLFMNGAGLWASVTQLLGIFADENSNVRGVFDCGDNSLF